ncbi:MAG: NIPSNAP family protein [Candidatus Eremiobacteraeota bacterium]|nr:NIPSNAP family protein [Candidatus Eremiobacteraeota bacterium]
MFASVELRRYVMQPGRRDDLIALFDREFIETQEERGMTAIGHYRDLDDPDAFVWFRGFDRMESRAGALHAFYVESSVWKTHRAAANDTILDSDNVLLLRPARAHSGFDVSGLSRPAPSFPEASASVVGVAIFTLDGPADQAFLTAFETEVLPKLQRCSSRIAYFVTEERPNDFPRLPVREGEPSFVVTGVCNEAADVDAWLGHFATASRPEPMHVRTSRYERLRLEPAARALFR